MSKKLVNVILCLPLAAIGLLAQESELTVDQIVDKHVQALGGADKLKAIKSMQASGNASLMGGQIEAPITLAMKRPSKIRMEMSVQGKLFVRAYDGETAWTINPFAGGDDPQRLADNEAKDVRDNSDMDGALVDYKAKGSKVELLGKEDVEGTPAYKLKITKKSGNTETDYLNAKTYLPIKTVAKVTQMGEEIEVESYPSNFKQVNGVLIPHSIEQKTGGKTLMSMTIEKIEANPPLDDSQFKFPEKPKEDPKKTDKP
jgi:outer membrane lipoprotein-sorting protein